MTFVQAGDLFADFVQYLEVLDEFAGDYAAAALLWARNHIDVGTESGELKRMKPRILKRLDAVLKDRTPSTRDMVEFRERYPQDLF